MQLKRRCVELRDVHHIQATSMNWSVQMCECVKDGGAVQQDYRESHAVVEVFKLERRIKWVFSSVGVFLQIERSL